ncbi:hypothetical protein ED733_009022 [Metarhizium rileyi]|uniref:Uncharacterized protein n=1 Tax=Metarhizium rileyi (strain RCEF 4871) TaxID=1649241 RepID=A0A5C6GQM5_METRR|nr:hypothetical protein ED733_009022 [Metarhizium rileyi]
MPEYEEVLGHMSGTSLQSDFFSHPAVPALMRYIVSHQDPSLGTACTSSWVRWPFVLPAPSLAAGLVEKHGLSNRYTESSVIFNCPHHGEHSISFTNPCEVARLEANTPTRNLIRSMTHLLE